MNQNGTQYAERTEKVRAMTSEELAEIKQQTLGDRPFYGPGSDVARLIDEIERLQEWQRDAQSEINDGIKREAIYTDRVIELEAEVIAIEHVSDQRTADMIQRHERKNMDRIAELEAENKRFRHGLEALKKTVTHYTSEDCWYSCPKSEEGCCDENGGDDCNCGADEIIAVIDAALQENTDDQ